MIESFARIHPDEPPASRIHPPGPVVLEAGVRVVGLAREGVRLRVGAGVGDEFAEGGVGVAVGDGAGFVGQPADGADAVGVDEAGLPVQVAGAGTRDA